MTLATYELIWLKQLIQELKFVEVSQMKLLCNNQVALHIASNPMFHERTKHIEIDCHFEKKFSPVVLLLAMSAQMTS